MIKDGSFLVTATLGRNIILSSGASHPLDLRGPYDVINLYVEKERKKFQTNFLKKIIALSYREP